MKGKLLISVIIILGLNSGFTKELKPKIFISKGDYYVPAKPVVEKLLPVIVNKLNIWFVMNRMYLGGYVTNTSDDRIKKVEVIAEVEVEGERVKIARKIVKDVPPHDVRRFVMLIPLIRIYRKFPDLKLNDLYSRIFLRIGRYK